MLRPGLERHGVASTEVRIGGVLRGAAMNGAAWQALRSGSARLCRVRTGLAGTKEWRRAQWLGVEPQVDVRQGLEGTAVRQVIVGNCLEWRGLAGIWEWNGESMQGEELNGVVGT